MKDRQNGFTIAELLITVAIIGGLVAISIPIISGQLKKSRAAVDAANVRSAKAAAVSDYLVDCITSEETYYYDASQGVVKDSADDIKAYGKSTDDLTKENIMEDYAEGVPQDGIVEVVVASEGVQSLTWIKATDDVEDISQEPNHPLEELALKSWEEYRKTSQNGLSCPAGSLFIDKGQVYVFYRNSDWYQGDYRHKSLEELMEKYPDCVKKIMATTTIKACNEYQKGDIVEAGTIVKVSDKKYLIRCVTKKLADETISEGSDNWEIIQ
ncbi:prepilin-type N-terminal cleavage/methylation domain-containing protein [Granulicatella balaenopterae]|uniref:Prepilin-type N-terminal cleavage/methylation domain-containing protein n=1 Tax=Granulicatella balaenopterae TaxID=137733 RepID=A0A1H9IST5_9LACT|nr:prepilin-type N-terminal cleavage/methylation domain-containing protein [Granulicatella balaenopterae]SEQ77660.1 prepilin-type N-terminal cleavage/methylation domain-containing protein [Granulicatella balaenopterae]